ncbi:MAG: DNA methyltransferase [Candidatus Phlomobacter fragariae]
MEKSGFRVVCHLIFKKNYESKSAFLEHSHEKAYLLAKSRPVMPIKPMKNVQSWQYIGNFYHPTQKPISSLQPLIESFTQPHVIVLDPFWVLSSTCIAEALSGRRYIGIELLSELANNASPLCALVVLPNTITQKEIKMNYSGHEILRKDVPLLIKKMDIFYIQIFKI